MDDLLRRRSRLSDSYGLLFLLLLAIMLLLAIGGDSRAGRTLMLVTVAVATWQGLRASHVRPVVLRTTTAAILSTTLIASVLAQVSSEQTSKTLVGCLLLLLVVVSPLAIVKDFARNPVVTKNTFFAAVSVYLLSAMFYATLYQLIATISGDQFFAQHTNPRAVDYLYFSFTTITTTGYGDYTAAGSIGKMTAMIEAIMGQLYLITVVALVVQNLGASRQRAREEERERERQ